MKYFNNTVGNRTRDLPAFSTVPEPPATQFLPENQFNMHIIVSIKEDFLSRKKNLSLIVVHCSLFEVNQVLLQLIHTRI